MCIRDRADCDVLIAVGTRFSDRVALNPKTFAKNATIIQIDIDPSELGKNVDCLLYTSGPGQRADNVDVDVIRAPLGGCHAGQAADALLGGSAVSYTHLLRPAGL